MIGEPDHLICQKVKNLFEFVKKEGTAPSAIDKIILTPKKIQFFFIKDILCNFLVRTLQCFQIFFFFFCPQQVEKTTLKSCSEKLKSTFFSLHAEAAQTAQKEKFMFQNVAYRPTVYRTGGFILQARTSSPLSLSHFCRKCLFLVTSLLHIRQPLC